MMIQSVTRASLNNGGDIVRLVSIGFCALFLFLVMPSISTASQYSDKSNFQHVLDRHDIVLGEIRSILQDRKGFMWFGGENALVRYDGYSLKEVHIDGKSVLSINKIVEDASGNLWIASRAGVLKYDLSLEKLTRLPDHKSLLLEPVFTREATDICELSGGRLAIATLSGLYIVDAHDGRGLRLGPEGNSPLSHHIVNSIYLLDKTLWIGTAAGLDELDLVKGEVVHHKPYSDNPSSLIDNGVVAMVQGEQSRLWLGTSNGLIDYDPTTRRSHRYQHDPGDPNSLSENDIWDVYKDSRGDIWVSTDHGGLVVFNSEEELFVAFRRERNRNSSLKSDVVRTVVEDSSGDIWVGLYPTGVEFFDQSSASIITHTRDVESANGLVTNSVQVILPGADNTIWLSTAIGLQRYTPELTHYEYFPFTQNGGQLKGLPGALSMHLDSEGTLWAGTWGKGVMLMDVETKATRRLPFDSKRDMAKGISVSKRLNNNKIWCLEEDAQGYIWMCTHEGGLSRYDRDTQSYLHFTYDESDEQSILSDLVWDVLEDSEGTLWVATSAGLSQLDRDKNTFAHYTHSGADTGSISHANVLSIFEDSKNRLWFGTGSGLNLFDKATGTFTRYGVDDGFINGTIRSIIEDSHGHLWMGTNNGVIAFAPDTGVVKNYNRVNGELVGGFSYRSALMTDSGEAYFGGFNGLRVFQTRAIQDNTLAPPVVVVDFKLFAESIKSDNENGLLKKSITYTDAIVLDYNDSVFEFEFAALNYRDSEKNSYAYRLVGFDEDWVFSGEQRRAKYTNIDSGDYTFQVKAANNHGYWNERGVSIQLRVLPVFWKTWTAYVIYCIAFGLCLIATLYIHNKKLAFEREQVLIEREKLKREQEVVQKLTDLDRLKDSFLANTSHELRTPLNGIVGLAESLLNGVAGRVNTTAESKLSMIISSGLRLASLVDEILDYSKMKAHSPQLTIARLDLFVLIESVLDLSRPLVGGKPVDLVNNVSPNEVAVLADENRLRQIIHNLVGNAIKFTIEGSVSITAQTEANFVWVNVIDTGIGIPKEMHKSIFNSFEQVDGSSSREFSGTGLGLAVSKGLVEAHGGDLQVVSQLGVGSTFRFSLLVANTIDQVEGDAKADKGMLADAKSGVSQVFASPPPSCFSDDDNQANSEPLVSVDESLLGMHVLIVDDEPVNRMVLESHLLLVGYKTTSVGSGLEALECADSEAAIDLVLLDVMMPHMSGYECCKKLREQRAQQSLPIIFLTAKSRPEDLIKGFHVGGNDFLNKPILTAELLSRVKIHLQLLQINRNLESIVSERTSTLEHEHKQLQIAQDKLLQSEKMASLSNLVAGMAHEFNNPLNFFKVGAYNIEVDMSELDGVLDTLLSGMEQEQGGELIAEVQLRLESIFDSLSSMRDGADRIRSLVDDLHSFSRLGGGGREPVLLSTLIRGGVSWANSKYGESIKMAINIEDCNIQCCAPSISQAFRNIIENSCQSVMSYQENSSSAYTPMLTITSTVSAKNLEVRFVDNGVGIDSHELRHVFEPFVTGKSVGNGVGLGLSIAYSAITGDGGSIRVESTVAQGATVVVSFPRSYE